MGMHDNYAEVYGSSRSMSYPAEYVIRIFKGAYPRLELPKDEYGDSRILDVGCGDGRHLVFLSDLGFEVVGTEATEAIVQATSSTLKAAGVDVPVRVGTNDDLPFEDASFDYLLSWNTCYYMGETPDFPSHVAEYARVLRPGGRLVLSVPKASCFIYEGSDPAGDGYRIVREDPFGVRDGTVLRMFEDLDELLDAFSPAFDDFTTASVHDDCFGYAYHWHLVVARRTEEV